MDCATIDSFKLNRFELLFFHFFKTRFSHSNRGQAVGIRELVTTLAVAGILFIVGVLIFSKIDTSVIGTSTATTNIPGIAGAVLDSSQLGIIAIVVLAAVVILGVLFTIGGGIGVRELDFDLGDEDEDNVSMETEMKKADKYNKEYFKEEVDYDDDKKSRFSMFFKKKDK